MIETVACPTCRRPLRVPDTLLGQLVKCPACEQTFTATEDLERPPRSGLDRSRSQEVDRLEEEEEQRPARDSGRGARARDEDAPDIRRRRRDRDDDDDDDDDRGPVRRRRRKRSKVPGKVTAIAVMTLVGGIYAVFQVLVLVLLTCGFWLLIPTTYFGLVCGILCIIKGSQLLSPSGRYENPPRTTAILQVINVINLDLINVTLGILNLVFINDEEVRGYYRG